MTQKPIKDGAHIIRDAQGNKRLFTEAEAKAYVESLCDAKRNSNPRLVSIFSTGSFWRFKIDTWRQA